MKVWVVLPYGDKGLVYINNGYMSILLLLMLQKGVLSYPSHRNIKGYLMGTASSGHSQQYQSAGKQTYFVTRIYKNVTETPSFVLGFGVWAMSGMG